MSEDSTNNKLDRRIESAENTLRYSIVILIICAVFAVIATGLGIYSATQANKAFKILEENGITDNSNDASEIDDEDELSDEDEEEEEEVYAKPTSVDSIDTIEIVYNNGKDFADIFDDGTIEFYAVDLEGEYVSNDVEDIDATEIINDIFKNNLDKFSETGLDENDNWGIVIYSEEGTSYVGGKDNAPDWFNDILKRINVDANGYQSKNF